MVPAEHQIAKVDGVFNAVFIHGDAVDDTMFYGQGAGMMPTASAVVGDIVDIGRDILSGAVGRVSAFSYTDKAIKDIPIGSIEELCIPYYLRFFATDKPGVLSKIAGVLGENGISISSVIQKGREKGGVVTLVVVTHRANEADLLKALEAVRALGVVEKDITLIRIEENLGGDR